MNCRIIDLKSTNPYKNVASEYYYYSTIGEDDIVFLLWQNSPCVVIGRNQNIYQELDLEYITKNKIFPVRRFTGGGAVYHDLGNLNYTFISNQKNKDMKKWMQIILKALEYSNIRAKLDGRNDLTIDDKKFSGMAWIEDDNKFMVHGTLMVDLDLSVLIQCLTPDISKFTGKGIKSVKSRVINLKELDENLKVETLKNNLIKSLKNFYPLAKTESHINSKEEKEIFHKITSNDWIYGKNEKAQIEKRYYYNNKPLDFEMWIDSDIINKVKIYTDSLDLKGIEELKSNLVGEKYSQIQIQKRIKKYIS